MSKKVIIYTQPNCPPCMNEKIWLKNNNIPYEEKDIRKNNEYLNELLELGASGTPATVIKDGLKETIVLGFDRYQLASILQIEE